MGREFDIPMVGVKIPCIGGQNIMYRGVKITWIGGRYTMGGGSIYHG